MHVATGAVGGLVSGSPLAAAVIGPVIHFFGDRVPHEDLASHRFEAACGVVGVLALAVPVFESRCSSPRLRVPASGNRKPAGHANGWHARRAC